jgi:hypothetical protein
MGAKKYKAGVINRVISKLEVVLKVCCYGLFANYRIRWEI